MHRRIAHERSLPAYPYCDWAHRRFQSFKHLGTDYQGNEHKHTQATITLMSALSRSVWRDATQRGTAFALAANRKNVWCVCSHPRCAAYLLLALLHALALTQCSCCLIHRAGVSRRQWLKESCQGHLELIFGYKKA
eukprot:1154778-Pelagomonas_calceolata.AAC.3